MSLKTIVKTQQTSLAHHMKQCYLSYMLSCCLALTGHHLAAGQSPNHAADPSEPSSGLILKRLGARMEAGLSLEQHLAYLRHFDRIDMDHDGHHSTAEYIEKGDYLTPQARRGIFQAADENGDAKVSRAEYVLNRAITDEAKGILLSMDKDRDMAVTWIEFQAHTDLGPSEISKTEVFDQLDTNGDRSLVIPEFLRVWGRWARQGQAPANIRLDLKREQELDRFWQKVSITVQEGDFEGYAATCHAEGVLVSGSSSTSYPLAHALVRWKKGFQDTKSGAMQASVDFKFSHRMGDATTAHERGIFRYETKRNQETTVDWIHFEALLVKKESGWKVLMEYQQSAAGEHEWQALQP